MEYASVNENRRIEMMKHLAFGYKVILIWMFIDVSLIICFSIVKEYIALLSIVCVGIIKIIVCVFAILDYKKYEARDPSGM